MHETDFDMTADKPLPHSKIGIASFAVALFGTLIFCSAFAIAFYIEFTGGGVVDPASPAYLIIEVAMCGSVIINLIGLGLGIASLFQAQAKKTFGIIGLVLSVLMLCAYGILFIIGLASELGMSPGFQAGRDQPAK